LVIAIDLGVRVAGGVAPVAVRGGGMEIARQVEAGIHAEALDRGVEVAAVGDVDQGGELEDARRHLDPHLLQLLLDHHRRVVALLVAGVRQQLEGEGPAAAVEDAVAVAIAEALGGEDPPRLRRIVGEGLQVGVVRPHGLDDRRVGDPRVLAPERVDDRLAVDGEGEGAADVGIAERRPGVVPRDDDRQPEPIGQELEVRVGGDAGCLGRRHLRDEVELAIE
jgi:hypothetical protein